MPETYSIPGPVSGIPIGVYRTANPDIDAILAYEEFIGRRVSYVLAFMADSPNWDQFERAILQNNTNGPPGSHSATEWAALLDGRELMLGVPACVAGSSWSSEAGGANDGHWVSLARTLTGAGLGDCVLRIGRELNGSWYPWKVDYNSRNTYKSAYARIVGTMRGAGFSGKFCWNPFIGQGTFGPNHGAEDAYPGDGVVDSIGIDLYDGDLGNGKWFGYPSNADAVTTSQHQQFFDSLLTIWDSLRGWYNLALSHGKPICFPEWGLRLWKDGGTYRGGGDNEILVRGMARFIHGTDAYMHAMWEDRCMGVSDPDNHPNRTVHVPLARSAFLAEFGE